MATFGFLVGFVVFGVASYSIRDRNKDNTAAIGKIKKQHSFINRL